MPIPVSSVLAYNSARPRIDGSSRGPVGRSIAAIVTCRSRLGTDASTRRSTSSQYGPPPTASARRAHASAFARPRRSMASSASLCAASISRAYSMPQA